MFLNIFVFVFYHNKLAYVSQFMFLNIFVFVFYHNKLVYVY